LKAAFYLSVLLILALLTCVAFIGTHNKNIQEENKDLKNDLKYYKYADSLSQITIKKCLDFNNP